jgi:hypothetical protein
VVLMRHDHLRLLHADVQLIRDPKLSSPCNQNLNKIIIFIIRLNFIYKMSKLLNMSGNENYSLNGTLQTSTKDIMKRLIMR